MRSRLRSGEVGFVRASLRLRVAAPEGFTAAMLPRVLLLLWSIEVAVELWFFEFVRTESHFVF